MGKAIAVQITVTIAAIVVTSSTSAQMTHFQRPCPLEIADSNAACVFPGQEFSRVRVFCELRGVGLGQGPKIRLSRGPGRPEIYPSPAVGRRTHQATVSRGTLFPARMECDV